MLQLTRGKIIRAQRITIYGPEGICKSTLASLFPNPLFMDVEQGTHELDVVRTQTPQSFEMVRQITADFGQDPQGHLTFVVDTADWAERWGIVEVCSQLGIASLGSDQDGKRDWGKSYNTLKELWAKWLDSLTEICMTKGIHIVVLAHAQTRKNELPEEIGSFDRWEMKLEKKVSALQKEWSDMLLFVGYKTLVVADDKTKTKKGTGGQRVIRTSHHPAWDAKNRHNLPEEIMLTEQNKMVLPEVLQNIFFGSTPPPPPQPIQQPVQQPQQLPPQPPVAVAPPPQPQMQKPPQPPPQAPVPTLSPDAAIDTAVAASLGVPASLIQLMETHDVTELDIRKASAKQGYYPLDTPITKYDPKYINHLVSVWPQVLTIIKNLTEGAQA